MLRSRTNRTLARLILGLSLLTPALLGAQELDDTDTPLGDVARSLRKKSPSSQQEIIDNDNLTKVMDDADSRRRSRSSLLYSIDGLGNAFQVSAPDVTCSLSFSVNAKSLLSSSYMQMDLPPDQLLKLSGPAAIHGDALEVSVFNGTDWHVSEVAVALTVVRRGEFPEAYLSGRSSGSRPGDDDLPKLVPAAAIEPIQEPDIRSENRSEKRPDIAVLYHMRAAAVPFAVTMFATPLNMDIAPDQEWHWAIVQAKGYPPQQHLGDQAPGRGIPTAAPQTEPGRPASPTAEATPTPPPQANPSQSASTQPSSDASSR